MIVRLFLIYGKHKKKYYIIVKGYLQIMFTIICIILCIYFIPTLLAVLKRSPHLSQIAITNLLLGWSIIFWIFSFRLAMGWDQVSENPTPGNTTIK